MSICIDKDFPVRERQAVGFHSCFDFCFVIPVLAQRGVLVGLHIKAEPILGKMQPECLSNATT